MTVAELLDALRAAGLRVGPREHAQIARLLGTPSRVGDAQLRVALRCVVAKSGEEQETFERVFAQLAAQRPVASTDGAHRDEAPTRAAVPGQRRVRAAWALAASLMVLLVGLGLYLRPRSEAPPQPQSPASQPSDKGTRPPPPSPWPCPEPWPPTALPWGAPPPASLAAAAGAVVLLAFALRRWRKRTRSRAQKLAPPYLYQPRFLDEAKLRLSTTQTRAIVQRVADATPDSEAGALLTEATVDATTHAAGCPTLVYAEQHAVARVVLLTDTAASLRATEPYAQQLVANLARAGVDVVRASYDRDPTYVRQSWHERAVPLQTLLGDRDAVLLLGDAAFGRERTSDRLAPFVKVLQQQPVVLWLNVLPRTQYGDDAHVLASVLPMVSLAEPDLPSADGRRVPVALDAPRQLRGYLGAEAADLLAVAARLAEPSASLLLWLARALDVHLADATWLRVLTLPWLNEARWPLDLVAALAGEPLSMRGARWLVSARTALRDALQRERPPAGSFAELAWSLQVAQTDEARGRNGALRELADSPLAAHAERARGRLGVRRFDLIRIDLAGAVLLGLLAAGSWHAVRATRVSAEGCAQNSDYCVPLGDRAMANNQRYEAERHYTEGCERGAALACDRLDTAHIEECLPIRTEQLAHVTQRWKARCDAGRPATACYYYTRAVEHASKRPIAPGIAADAQGGAAQQADQAIRQTYERLCSQGVTPACARRKPPVPPTTNP